MKTEFAELCEKCESSDPITDAEKYTRKSVAGDKKKLMRLKAEAKKEDIQNYASTMLSLVAIMLSLVAITWNFSDAVSECMKADGSFCYHVAAAVIYRIAAVVEICCLAIVVRMLWSIKQKSKIVGKWGAYVEVVLDEIEKEMEKEEKMEKENKIKKELEKNQNRLEKSINDLTIAIREKK